MQGNDENGQKEDGILSIPKEDRETLFKRADDGLSTAGDVFLILRGRNIRNSFISFSEVELIFRRLGINLTEHRFCEFLSASKLAHSQKAVGYTKLNFSYIEESEFASILDYLEESVGILTKQNLKIAPRNLTNFSLLAVISYAIIIFFSQSMMHYFYGDDFLGAIICSIIPLGAMILLSRTKVMANIEPGALKDELSKAFEVITNSKAEHLA